AAVAIDRPVIADLARRCAVARRRIHYDHRIIARAQSRELIETAAGRHRRADRCRSAVLEELYRYVWKAGFTRVMHSVLVLIVPHEVAERSSSWRRSDKSVVVKASLAEVAFHLNQGLAENRVVSPGRSCEGRRSGVVVVWCRKGPERNRHRSCRNRRHI